MSQGSSEQIELNVLDRSEHSISRQQISESALKVLYRLDKAGYRACLVGGGVRDVLLGKQPKDFDVATDATPDEVRALFKNSRLIGRRFRLAHIRFGREVIEVATFRSLAADSSKTELSKDGRILRDNTFGSIEEDALRRDFTINALYYDIHDFSVLDYAQGIEDLKNSTLKLIGDPAVRYKEDPVRMLRAVRFAAKLDFSIEQSAARAIYDHGRLLRDIPPARLYDEVLKIFHSGHALRAYQLLRHFDLFGYLFPALEKYLNSDPSEVMLDFIEQALVNTDERVRQDKPVSPAFIFAALLWPLVHQRAIQLQSEQISTIPALHNAGSEIFQRQVQTIAVPRRFSQIAKNIWAMQPRFSNTRGKQPLRLLNHPNFRAGYDFFCIQSMVGLSTHQLCQWWTRFQQEQQQNESKDNKPRRGGHRPRRHRRPRNRSQAS
ncbi:MAG: polynucleotide adenylyltransferase PcnB [Gammaproteobacteria bacterium]|nr:polynucleotide adenylyltransferase PcnB [Gammaproteobacteria bacterium]